jgi:hypothetical protein
LGENVHFLGLTEISDLIAIKVLEDVAEFR